MRLFHFPTIVTSFAGTLLTALTVHASPVACFNSVSGQFCIELFETQAPITTSNFMRYINSGAYTQGIFHRSVPGFVVQAGGYKIASTSNNQPSIFSVNTFPPINNEFGLSNKRGTVAMAKIADDADSATSQWFVNLSDNSSNLDRTNGGYTVFGQIVFDGMNVIDTIASLPVVAVNQIFNEIPLVNYDTSKPITLNNLVQIFDVKVTDVTGIFHAGTLNFAVDIGENSPGYRVNLKLIQNSPDFIFELDSTNLEVLSVKPTNTAIFSTQDGLLTIPSIMIEPFIAVKNVVMRRSSPDTYQFRLESYESVN